MNNIMRLPTKKVLRFFVPLLAFVVLADRAVLMIEPLSTDTYGKRIHKSIIACSYTRARAHTYLRCAVVYVDFIVEKIA